MLRFQTGQGYDEDGNLIEPKVLYPETKFKWLSDGAQAEFKDPPPFLG